MIRAVVYFHGPMTEWQGKPADSEVVARFEHRWQWVAQSNALAALKMLNSGRCGLLITDAKGRILEHREAAERSKAAA